MVHSRVVSRSFLLPYLERGIHRHWTNPETVDEIVEIIARTSKPVLFPNDLKDHVSIRYEEIIQDQGSNLPYSTSGGALTCKNPVDLFRYLEERVPRQGPSDATILTDNITVSTFWHNDTSTLTFNILRKY